jgi:hypothetical protein
VLPRETEETRKIKEQADQLTKHNTAPPQKEPTPTKEPVPA